MAIIKVDTEGVVGLCQMVAAFEGKAGSALNYVLNAKQTIDINTASSEAISARLTSIQKRLTTQQNKLIQYKAALTSVNEKFSSADKAIAGKAKDTVYLLEKISTWNPAFTTRNTLKIVDEQDNASKVLSLFESSDIDTGDLIKFAGEFGFVGSTVALGAGLIYDNSEKNVASTAIKGVGLLAKTAKSISEGKTVDMFGVSKTVDAIGFSENLAQSLDSYTYNSSYNSANLTGAAKTWQNVGVIAKWGGVALTAVGNLGDNLEEYNGDFSNPRMYAETIGETIVDVGLGILVGAGVATLAGATAPVWAVSIVSTGVVMGANWVSEQVFDADLGEVVSDAVINTVEVISDVKKEVVQTACKVVEQTSQEIGKAVTTTAKAITTTWNRLVNIF